ncbi:hypothetical protein A2361_00425 [Candidatus Woesebacteria bacterium RIFOXYB1_FULL_40_26]|uniref:Phosphoribosyl-ATP pyrophosphohydrolase n=3 Tax=Candidatus Woeseibacteriota TaxID=1752722 RepID=A0A0G0VKM2_9BACT|nr:MAG: hypothetical protein UU03_C0007G0009 [Candidatus Woesebacteria bacterium GW2011_GWA1_40_45]OGM81406.1 MAG: hypothetical protein A2361_00425 [Candidatus Woesebacteria bacterium RIFOXYB1_FULL_40_26]OGM86966.1 MAG: hypothetical protein A2614_01625 [Candidatus Woesebacteria bacterium RIFOXYD1_FULL_40_21]
MRKFRFSKLVRDKIVEDIISNSGTPRWKTLSGREYIQELKKKLVEEGLELLDARDRETPEELADIQEIIDNLLEALGITKERFAEIQNKKNGKRGSFKKRQYIDVVEVKDGAEVIKFYLDHPEKYPEVK